MWIDLWLRCARGIDRTKAGVIKTERLADALDDEAIEVMPLATSTTRPSTSVDMPYCHVLPG